MRARPVLAGSMIWVRDRSRRLFSGYTHRPETLAKWLARITGNPDSPTVRAGIRSMPTLNMDPLWDAQIEAIQNTKQSLRENRHRALISEIPGP
jgi:type I restriction enzyme, R subunit